MFFSHNPFRRDKYFPSDPHFPPLPNLTEGLVAYWPLESDFDDVSGNNFHLTPYGQTSQFVSTPMGQAFYARPTFSGSTANGSYAYVNNLPTNLGSYDNSKAFTFVFWIVPYVDQSSGYEPDTISLFPTIFGKEYHLGYIGDEPENYLDPFPDSTYDPDQYNPVGNFEFVNGGRQTQGFHGPRCSLKPLDESYISWASQGDYIQRATSYAADYAMVSISYFDQLNNPTQDFTEYYDGPMTAVETYTYLYPPSYYITKQISPFYSLSFFNGLGEPLADPNDYYQISNWTRFYLGLCFQGGYVFRPIAVKHVGLWYRRLARHELDYLYYCQAQRLPF